MKNRMKDLTNENYPKPPLRLCNGPVGQLENEYYNRDAAMDILKYITNDETVILSDDLDEIVKFEKVQQWRPELGNSASFEIQNF